MMRPPFSTTPPPKSISNSTPLSVSTVFLPTDLRGACSTSTSLRPVVERIMWRSTREPSGRVTWSTSNPFLTSFCFSFSLRFISRSNNFLSFLERVVVGKGSGSSSQSSHSSSSVGLGSSVGASIAEMSSHSSSGGGADSVMACSASSVPSSAVNASKSVSSATSLTRLRNRSKKPMESPSHQE